MSVENKTVNGKTLAQSTSGRVPGDVREWARTKLAYEDGVKAAFLYHGGRNLKLTVNGETSRIEAPDGYRIDHVGTTASLTHIWFAREGDR